MTRSDGFSVDPDALSQVQDGVGRRLRDMHEITVPDPADGFGDDEVADEVAKAAAEFREAWSGGVGELVRETESFHERLGETIAEYRRADEAAAGDFDRIGRD